MKRFVIVLAGLVLVAALVLILLTNQEILAKLSRSDLASPTSPTMDAPDFIKPSTASVIKSGNRVQAACQLQPKRSASLGFNSSGLLVSINVSPGQTINAGTVLASLAGSSQIEAELISAQRELVQAEQEIKKLNDEVYLAAAQSLKTLRDAELNEKNARSSLKKLEEADKSSEEIAQAEAALGWIRAQIRQAKEVYDRDKNGPDPLAVTNAEMHLKEAEARVAAAKEAQVARELVAPFNGTVVEILLEQGEFVAPGTPVVLLADLNQMLVETTNVTELNILEIHTGDPAEIKFDAIPDSPFSGTVIKIDTVGKKVQGDILFSVFMEGDFSSSGLLWGMTCSATIGK